MKSDKTVVLNRTQIQQKIRRIAYQLYEDNYQEKELIIAGIQPNGYGLAEKIKDALGEISKIKTSLIGITLDKDNPYQGMPDIGLKENQYTDKVIIIVDDVLNSGKTIAFALKPFLNTPVKKIRTVALVHRSHKRYPVSVDFIGISLATTLQEHITVDLRAGKEQVLLQ